MNQSFDFLLKRIFDFSVALVGLVLTGPIILIGILIIRLSSSGPAIFQQTRIGAKGCPFTIFKLRTMHVDADRKLTQTTASDPMVFPAGQFLRRFKIDELPQIFNVLKGDMSLIGPRPCMPQTKDQMPHWARPRFQMRPGMTGLAQVNGNASISWEERWRYDVQYVKTFSLLQDFKIILRTFLVVFLGEEKYGR